MGCYNEDIFALGLIFIICAYHVSRIHVELKMMNIYIRNNCLYHIIRSNRESNDT